MLKAGEGEARGRWSVAPVRATLKDESGGTESGEGPRVAYLVIWQG